MKSAPHPTEIRDAKSSVSLSGCDVAPRESWILSPRHSSAEGRILGFGMLHGGHVHQGSSVKDEKEGNLNPKP